MTGRKVICEILLLFVNEEVIASVISVCKARSGSKIVPPSPCIKKNTPRVCYHEKKRNKKKEIGKKQKKNRIGYN